MLFESQEPNLVGMTRHYATDPATNPSKMFSDQMVKNCINLAYLSMYRDMARSGQGPGNRITYLNTTANVAEVDLPDGLIDVELVLVSYSGQDLSSVAARSSDAVEMTNSTAKDAAGRQDLGLLASNEYRAYLTDEGINLGTWQLGLVPAPTVTATNAIKIYWKGTTELLQNPSDEPQLDPADHDLLCRKAALKLKPGMELRLEDLLVLNNMDEAAFSKSGHSKIKNPSARIPVAGSTRRSRSIRTTRRDG